MHIYVKIKCNFRLGPKERPLYQHGGPSHEGCHIVQPCFLPLSLPLNMKQSMSHRDSMSLWSLEREQKGVFGSPTTRWPRTSHILHVVPLKKLKLKLPFMWFYSQLRPRFFSAYEQIFINGKAEEIYSLKTGEH